MYEMYSNWPCQLCCLFYRSALEKKECSDTASRRDNLNDVECPSVTTLEEKECAEDNPDDKVGSTSSAGRRPCAVLTMNQQSNLRLRRTATSPHRHCLGPKLVDGNMIIMQPWMAYTSMPS